jgi:chaperonin GroES
MSEASQEMQFRKPGVEISTLPIRPLAWRLLIRPFEPEEKTAGGIIKPDETREAEELLTYVGQIVAMGSQCYKAVTRSGIDLSKEEMKPVVGDWVIYGVYGGTMVRMKGGGKYLIANDDAILGIVRDPLDFKYYI